MHIQEGNFNLLHSVHSKRIQRILGTHNFRILFCFDLILVLDILMH